MENAAQHATEALSNKNHYAEQKEPADFDEANATKRLDKAVADLKAADPTIDNPNPRHGDNNIIEGERGFLAITDAGSVVAKTRKELRQRLASLAANEAYSHGSEPIEIYRVTRLPLARKVDFKF